MDVSSLLKFMDYTLKNSEGRKFSLNLYKTFRNTPENADEKICIDQAIMLGEKAEARKMPVDHAIKIVEKFSNENETFINKVKKNSWIEGSTYEISAYIVDNLTPEYSIWLVRYAIDDGIEASNGTYESIRLNVANHLSKEEFFMNFESNLENSLISDED